ncbi:MAG TPA: NUDIX domain-containing protein [Bdellovibrionales bacterium]|nr:NUDIX domain-containing protein [Bdellovibrionales bacterium]
MTVALRRASRAVILTPQNEILLIKISNPNGKWVGWITPGGGIDSGESIEDALKRELSEEVGLKDFKIAGHLWSREVSFEWMGQHFDQREEFFLIRTNRFDVHANQSLTKDEMMYLNEFRWWTLPELEKTQETLAPTRLCELLKEIVVNGPPNKPIDAGD